VPKRLTINEICERALRKIGAFSIRDTGADAAEMAEARYWLDMIVSHVSSLRRAWWRVPNTLSVTLTGGVSSYVLSASLAGGVEVQSVISAWRVAISTGEREQIAILRRQEWESRDGTATAGPPECCYIDRSRDPVLRVWPTPPTPPLHRIELVLQPFTPDFQARGPTNKMDEVRENWHLFLVTALAAEIGNGPVRKLPADEVREMQVTAKALLYDLMDYDSHEQADEPRLVAVNPF
jgi:hypothetical protein